MVMITWMLATLPEGQQGGLVAAEIGVTDWQKKLHTYPLNYTDTGVTVSASLSLLWEAAISSALTQQMFQAMLQQLTQTPGNTATTAEWRSVREVSLQPGKHAQTSLMCVNVQHTRHFVSTPFVHAPHTANALNAVRHSHFVQQQLKFVSSR
jgi:hypothetical protein